MLDSDEAVAMGGDSEVEACAQRVGPGLCKYP
jgi:hypothetical protein